jgi:hypothetical protein
MTFLMLIQEDRDEKIDVRFLDDGFSDFQILEFKLELKFFGTQIKKI